MTQARTTTRTRTSLLLTPSRALQEVQGHGSARAWFQLLSDLSSPVTRRQRCLFQVQSSLPCTNTLCT